MMRYKISFVFLLFLFLININENSYAQDDSLKSQVLKALNECANYATDVLLDEYGRSRCDYNLTEGKWYLYEPAWHTGQIINGLVEA